MSRGRIQEWRIRPQLADLLFQFNFQQIVAGHCLMFCSSQQHNTPQGSGVNLSHHIIYYDRVGFLTSYRPYGRHYFFTPCIWPTSQGCQFLTWNMCKSRTAIWFSILMAVQVNVTMWPGSSGGDASLLTGAPLCSSMPYRRDTIPNSSVTVNVSMRWDGSSEFFLSNIFWFLKG
jgi:hypothetical protein